LTQTGRHRLVAADTQSVGLSSGLSNPDHLDEVTGPGGGAVIWLHGEAEGRIPAGRLLAVVAGGQRTSVGYRGCVHDQDAYRYARSVVNVELSPARLGRRRRMIEAHPVGQPDNRLERAA
jgi:hypothetical protein